jgi:RNA polymerase-binding protein DksA
MTVLNQQTMSRLRKVLDARYKGLVEDVREELERSGDQHYIDLAGRVTDAGDEAVAGLLADLDAAMIDRQVQELRDIEAARERIRTGGYGVCIDCGNEIGAARLTAYPTAKRCIQCQTKREKEFAHPGTPKL